MAYSPTDWTDGVTPVDAAHMDKIEAGLVAAEEKALKGAANGYAPLDASSQIPNTSLPVRLREVATLAPGDNLDTTDVSGWYYFDTDTVGRPANTYGYVQVYGWPGVLNTVQIAYRYDSLVIWCRYKPAGASAAWTQIFPLYLVNAAASSILTNKLLAADTNEAFRIRGDGRLEWGAGGASAIDLNLYRTAAGVLKTDFRLEIARNYFDALTLSGAAGGIQIGGDTNLYRAAANVLKTDGRLIAADAVYGVLSQAAAAGGYAFASFIGADSSPRWRVVGSDGKQEWGPGGAATPDTNLYRAAVDTLKTDDKLEVAGNPSGTLPVGLQVGATLPAHFQGGAGSGLNAVMGHNAWLRASDGLFVWAGSHGTFGSRVINMSYQAGIDFYADAAAATAGAVASPPLRLRIGNEGVVKAYTGFASLGYGTALPASPVDGQEFTLVDSTTNPSYQWRFRYNAGSSSAYKWEFIGGCPATLFGGDWSISGASTWQSPASGVVLPRAGEYDVKVTSSVYNPTGGVVTAYLAAGVNSTKAGDQGFGAIHANLSTNISLESPITYAASQQATQCYQASATTVTFQQNRLYVTPRRVS